ncbi:hypothetical protein RvY_13925 [Ramazzottius varieornatus]|uniref:Mitochondrial fission factor n=1 Tax=Ramazzottius varieornatus TaxID=947166 RepID=A0A1D1VRP0_RAMVA|nr:hypothetical protein RvY_13925 [Ramazzottius varieornatus]
MIDQAEDMDGMGMERDNLARGDGTLARDRLPSVGRSAFQNGVGESAGDDYKTSHYRANTRANNHGPLARDSQPLVPPSQFSQDISRQMRVPEQIRPYYEEDPYAFASEFGARQGDTSRQMTVPDRILVAGNDQHVGLRENRPRESELDDMLYSFRTEPTVTVQTPPRTLTVSQHTFPTSSLKDVAALSHTSNVPSFADQANMEQALALQADVNMSSVGQSSSKNLVLRSAGGPLSQNGIRSGLPDTPATRLVVDLYKRVETLERENYHRYLREMVGYAVIFGYLALKTVSVFLKR